MTDAPAGIVRRGLPVLPWLLLLAGAALRIRVWAANRSLWGDEANLALNIVQRNFSQLALPLDHSQAAPLGYLWLTKAAVVLGGNHELVLRLVPLCAALISLPLFWLLARRLLPAGGALFALALFAGSSPLIYFASEVKPYACDRMFALLLIWLATRVAQDGPSLERLTSLAVVGAASVWFSYPAVFVLAGVGLTLGIQALAARRWSGLAALTGVGLAWAIAFSVAYLISIRSAAQSSYLNEFWAKGFLPWPVNWSNLSRWLAEVAVEWLTFIVPAPLAAVAAVAIVLGLWDLWRRSPAAWGILVGPLLVTGAAAAIHKYPFGPRLWLFHLPGMHILAAAGAAWLYGATSAAWWRKALGAVLGLALLGAPTWGVAKFAVAPPGRCEIRPLLEYLAPRVEPGDLVYQFGSRTPYLYYFTQERFAALREVPLIQGRVEQRDDPTQCRADVEQLRGRGRVWCLFTHPKGCIPNFLLALDQWGRRLDEQHAQDAALYLYDLTVMPVAPDDEPVRPASK